MGGLILRLKTWWQASDRTQKMIAVVGGGLFFALIIGTFVFASRPKMSLVFTNLDPEDAGNVDMEVQAMGIPDTFDANGNVSVPSDKVAAVRAGLAMKGKLPKPGNHFGTELSQMPFITDPTVLKERLKGIQEAELSEAIKVFENVDNAGVQITQAVDSPFEGEKKPAQANITITERSGSQVSAEEARAMASLVSSSVAGLDSSKVTIFTRSGRALWDGQDQSSGPGSANNKLDLEKNESRKKRDELQEALNRMLGPGNAIAMVNVGLDISQVEDVNTHRSKPAPVSTIDEKMTESGAGATPPPAGVDANSTDAPKIGAAGATGTAADKSSSGYTAKQTKFDPDFWQDETTSRTKRGVGEVKSMSVTVLVNKTDKVDAAALASIQNVADSFVGPKLKGDPANFESKVVAYPFDTSQAEAAAKAQDASAGSGKMQQILGFLPIAALLVVGFLVMKSLGKLANRPLALMSPAGGPALQMAPAGSSLMANAIAATNNKALESANRFVLPEIVKQKALEAGISEEQLQAAIEEAGEAGISVSDIPSIKSKINVPLEQIKRMVSEKPETVAMLVKSWLIEEGIRR